MVDYEIGYGKPPKHSQFKKGVCANPRGRPRRRDTQIGEVVRGFLSGKAQYREKGRTKKTSRLELAIKRHVTAALNGDVGSAAMLLKMRAHGLKFGDVGPLIIQLVNSPGLLTRLRAEEKEGLADPSAESLPHKAQSSAVDRILSDGSASS
jgi:hypothetical protein